MKHETTIPIYRINLFCTDKLKQLTNRVNKDVEDYNPDSMCHGRCVQWSDGDKYRNIGIYASSMPSLAHEAVHAANEVFDMIGQKPDLVNDECYSYLVEWFVREFTENINLK